MATAAAGEMVPGQGAGPFFGHPKGLAYLAFAEAWETLLVLRHERLGRALHGATPCLPPREPGEPVAPVNQVPRTDPPVH